MMKSRKLIGLDMGTGAVKGVLWDSSGAVEATAERPVPLSRPAEGHVEIDAAAYEALVVSLLRDLADASSAPIDAISMAAASGNTLLCDAEANPLTPIISWLDTRLDWCPPPEWNVREVTGWPPGNLMTPMHLEHFRRSAPEMLKGGIVAMNNDWLCWRLCGVHALDLSTATTFYLCNQTEERYEQRYLDHYGLTAAQLPKLVSTGTPVGKLLPRWAGGNLTTGTAVVAGSFDHPAAARAAGVLHAGELLLSCGTSWVGFLPYPDRARVPMSLLCDPFLSQGGEGGCWGAMFSLTAAGLRLEEFIVGQFGREAGRYDRFNDEALLEGTASNTFAMELLAELKKALAATGAAPRQAVFCGGPSRGKAWAPLLEKTLGIPIRPSAYKTSTGAVGAAMIALQGIQQ